MKIIQLPPPMRIALGVVLVCSALLASCQRENVDPSRLEIVAEGFQGTKMIVDGPTAQWSNGDVVRINGEDKTITVSGSSAYVTDVVSASEYCAIFPASIVSGSISGTTATVTLPSEYRYREDASGNQILDAPMMAYRSGSGRLEFKHLTAALVVELTMGGPDKWRLDSIIVTSSTGKLCGDMDVDFTDLASTTAATTSDVDNRVCMVFEDLSRFHENGQDNGDFGVLLKDNTHLSVQIPVRAVSNQKFTVRVVCHVQGADQKYVFERTQPSNTGIARNEIGYVKVRMASGEEGYSVLPSLLNTLPDGSYEVSNRWEFCAMLQYIRRGYQPHNSDSYTFTSDIDATGIVTKRCHILNNVIDGGGHTIRGLKVYDPAPMLFDPEYRVTIQNLTLKDITLERQGESNTMAYGPFSAHGCNKLRIIDCHTDGMTILGIRQEEGYDVVIGGIVGSHGLDSLTVIGCSFRGSISLEHNYCYPSSRTGIRFGGIVGQSHAKSQNYLDSIINCSVNMNATLSSTYKVYAGGVIGAYESQYVSTKFIAYGNNVTGMLTVSGGTGSSVGEIVGFLDGTLETDGVHTNTSSLIIN